MASLLVPCAHCHCHAKSTEVTCPSCGEPLRRNDGSVPRSAVAVLLGLTAASALSGSCSGSISSSGTQVFYGPAPTSNEASSSSGTGGTGGAGGANASSSSGTQVFYGPSPTTTGGGGTGGTTGTGGTGANDGGDVDVDGG
jgi:hypothetical protein